MPHAGNVLQEPVQMPHSRHAHQNQQQAHMPALLMALYVAQQHPAPHAQFVVQLLSVSTATGLPHHYHLLAMVCNSWYLMHYHSAIIGSALLLMLSPFLPS